MAANRSLALVTRAVDVTESSTVATLFTREMGKVSALAKGARRLKSAFQGGLDLLGVSDIVLLPKASESLDLLTEAAPVERFPCLRRDLAALYAGYYVAELLTELTDLHDPHPRLFDAARITLRHLGDVGLRPRRVVRFELACLREIGLAPSFDLCCQCGEPTTAERETAFGPASGGVLCPACRPGLPDVVTLDRRTIDLARALASPGNRWREWEPAGSDLADVRRVVGSVVSHAMGRRPRVQPYLGV